MDGIKEDVRSEVKGESEESEMVILVPGIEEWGHVLVFR
jgi:hypothetical protein